VGSGDNRVLILKSAIRSLGLLVRFRLLFLKRFSANLGSIFYRWGNKGTRGFGCRLFRTG